MEDAHTAAGPQEVGSDHSFAFFGIFDGHGGPRAANFTAAHLLPFLKEEAPKHCDLKQALHAALGRLEAEWLKQARKTEEPDGTCVAVVVISGKQLIAASIGDSEMVLCRNGHAVALCAVHNPSRNMAEARRIEAAGSLDKRRMRVVDPKNEHSLALSRTVGDVPYKDQDTGVIAEPDIKEYELCDYDAFVILGCDGLWDVVTQQEAVQFCFDRLQKGESPNEVAFRLVLYAFEKGSTDNISVCLVVLDHNTSGVATATA